LTALNLSVKGHPTPGLFKVLVALGEAGLLYCTWEHYRELQYVEPKEISSILSEVRRNSTMFWIITVEYLRAH
jgi:hypothetical protein